MSFPLGRCLIRGNMYDLETSTAYIFCPICCKVLHLLHGSVKDVKWQFLFSPSLTQSTQMVMLLMTFDNVVLIVSEVPCAVPILRKCSDMYFFRAPIPFCWSSIIWCKGKCGFIPSNITFLPSILGNVPVFLGACHRSALYPKTLKLCHS